MRLLVVVAALGLATASCTGTEQALPADVVLDEFAVTVAAAGTDAFTVANTGEFPHTLVITGANGSVVGATDLIPPGEVVVADFGLGPGSYEFTCRIVAEKPDGAIVDHFQEGMRARVDIEA